MMNTERYNNKRDNAVTPGIETESADIKVVH